MRYWNARDELWHDGMMADWDRTGPGAPGRSKRPPVSEARFRAICDDEGITAQDRPRLWDLLLRWRWPSADPDQQVEELLGDHRHRRLYLDGRNGDAAAARGFEGHWRRYARATLRWRLGPDDIDEVISMFYERVYERLGDEYAWRSPFTVYLATVMVNLARSRGRQLGARLRRETSLEQEGGVVAGIASLDLDPEQSVLRGERRSRMEAALGELVPLERALLLAVLVDGESGAELAASSGMRRDAVYKRVQRAKVKLRAILVRHGLQSD